MSAKTLTFPAFIDAFKAALIARSNLAGVVVSTGPLGAKAPPECICFVSCIDDIEWGALGAMREDETYVIEGYLVITKPGQTEATVKAARDRAAVLVNEMATALNDNVTLGVTGIVHSRISKAMWHQGASDQGRTCAIEFYVAVKARI